MIGTLTHYIQAVPIKSRESTKRLRGIEECNSTLTKNNFKGNILRLDNEVSKTLINYIETKAQLEYQLVSPHNHRANPAEQAIQTYKAQFISILSGVHPDFPDNCWDLLIPHTNLTLNIHCRSRLQPKLSAHTLIHGNFNFD
jgi:2-succinyl-5-enolpyruvyl-6-hydroxy-3-cyclohexene-1-carboxylate synthase